MAEVHYAVLDDMEKYRPYFNRKEYEGKEESEVHQEFKEFYNKVLPVDLLTWSRVNEPGDEMKYKKGYWRQIVFIRDDVNKLFYNTETYEDYQEIEKNPVLVINTHTSKSIKLPVYLIDLKKYGLKIILRDNFHDWKISVISDKEINVGFMDLFEQDKTISHLYCEGFKEDQVFGSYKDNRKQFTVEIHYDYDVYVFMYLLSRYLRGDNK